MWGCRHNHSSGLLFSIVRSVGSIKYVSIINCEYLRVFLGYNPSKHVEWELNTSFHSLPERINETGYHKSAARDLDWLIWPYNTTYPIATTPECMTVPNPGPWSNTSLPITYTWPECNMQLLLNLYSWFSIKHSYKIAGDKITYSMCIGDMKNS